MININAFKRRLFSIHDSYLLLRNQCVSEELEKGICDFRLMSNNDNLVDTHPFEDSEYYAPIYSAMLRKGDAVIFGYMPGNICVFRVCVQFNGNITNGGCFVKAINEKEGYVHYVYCDPEYRGKGIHNDCLRYINSLFPKMKLYSIVRVDNTASLKGFYRNGYFKIHRLKRINFLGLRMLIRKEI